MKAKEIVHLLCMVLRVSTRAEAREMGRKREKERQREKEKEREIEKKRKRER